MKDYLNSIEITGKMYNKPISTGIRVGITAGVAYYVYKSVSHALFRIDHDLAKKLNEFINDTENEKVVVDDANVEVVGDSNE